MGGAAYRKIYSKQLKMDLAINDDNTKALNDIISFSPKAIQTDYNKICLTNSNNTVFVTVIYLLQFADYNEICFTNFNNVCVRVIYYLLEFVK